jgi:hypothetical protein
MLNLVVRKETARLLKVKASDFPVLSVNFLLILKTNKADEFVSAVTKSTKVT